MKNPKREIEWSDLETMKSIGVFPLKLDPDGDYICPRCGKPATYWEGQIDETPMGQSIEGWSYDCYPCGIHSQVEYL